MRKWVLLVVSFLSLWVVPNFCYAGIIWEKSENLTDGSKGYVTQNNGAHKIVVDSQGGVHVVWLRDDGMLKWVIYKRSLDGGSTWGEEIPLSGHHWYTYFSAIAADALGVIHVVWAESDTLDDVDIRLMYRRSLDGGVTWENITDITPDNVNSIGIPAITTDSQGVVHLLFDGHNGDLRRCFYRRSFDRGTTWEKEIVVNDPNFAASRPSIAIDSEGVVHIAWVSDGVFYRHSLDGGTTWGDIISLISMGYNHMSYAPSIAADSKGGVHVVWQYGSNDINQQLYYRRSLDGGTIWDDVIKLTSTKRGCLFPNITADITDGNGIHIVWMDDRDERWYQHELYYRRSTNRGDNWEKDTRLTFGGFNFVNSPSIAADPQDKLHIIWANSYEGGGGLPTQIYYKRGTQLEITQHSLEIAK